MRPHLIKHLKRMTTGSVIASGDDGFAFQLNKLRIIASWGDGWEHVSVSTETRCPTWDEMNHIKDLFWHSDECVIQYHPPANRYVNCHPYCLHLWRPIGVELPMPPTYMVGPMVDATTSTP